VSSCQELNSGKYIFTITLVLVHACKLEIRIEETLTGRTNDNARHFFHRAFSIEKTEGV